MSNWPWGWILGSFCVTAWAIGFYTFDYSEKHRQNQPIAIAAFVALLTAAFSTFGWFIYGMHLLTKPGPPPELVHLEAKNWNCTHQRFVPYHTESGGKVHVPDGYICDQWSMK